MTSLIHRVSDLLAGMGVEHRLYGDRLLLEGEEEGQRFGIVVEVEPPLIRAIGLTDAKPSCEDAFRLLMGNFEARGWRFALDPEGYLAVVVEEPLEKLSPQMLRIMLEKVRSGVAKILSLGGAK